MSWHWLSSEENSRVTLADGVAQKLRLYVLDNRSCSGSDPELGGLLLGWIEQYYPLRVCIEDYEPIISEHCGTYALSDAERQLLEQAIRRPRGVGLKVIGFFRSYRNREPILDTPDQELFTTYFPNRSDVLLLLQPTSQADCRATFRFGDDFSLKLRHSFFQFYEGMSQAENTTPVLEPLPILGPVQDSSEAEVTAAVPESVPVPVSALDLSQNIETPHSPKSEPLSDFGIQVTSKNRLPWLVAAALVLLLIPAYIQLTGSRQPRSFVSTPQPAAVKISQPPVVAAAIPPASPPPPTVNPTPEATLSSSSAKPAIAVPPEIRREVQPDIPSGIRARIADRIVIPVRVRVSSGGEVVGAVLEGGGEKDGVHRYLRRAAAKAALAWSFDPAKTKEGIPIMAEREISFVFDP